MRGWGDRDVDVGGDMDVDVDVDGNGYGDGPQVWDHGSENGREKLRS